MTILIEDLEPSYTDKPLTVSDMASLFIRQPPQWALRGDPYLWVAMCNNFINVEIPNQKTDFENLISSEFKKITGKSIFCGNSSVHVPELRHGGMSSGSVTPNYWLKKAIPLLWSRALNEPFDWSHTIV